MNKNLKPVSWQAEEYIVREHNTGWYIGLFVIAAALSALAVFLEGWTFLALIIVSVVTILVFNLRPPRKITYHIDSKGITEGSQHYPFTDFRAFAILEEEGHFSAILLPKKRLGISVKVYFPEGSGEAIVDQLGAHLTMEPAKLDFLDKIVNFLRI